MRAIANVLANWGAFIIGTAITFVLSPFVVHQLGDVRYGLWGVIGSLVGYLGLLDLGVRLAVTRFVAQHDARRDDDAINRLVTTARVLFAGAGLLACLVGGVAALLLPHLASVPPEYQREGAIALTISGLTVAVALVSGVYGGILAGLQRMTLLNAIDLGIELCRAVAVVVALRAGGGLIGLGLIQLGAVVIRGTIYLAVSKRLLPRLRTSLDQFDRTTLREIVKFSTVTMILHVSAVVIFSSDALVIAAIMPVVQVAFFVIASNLAQAVLRIIGGVSQALFPLISARQATHGTEATASLAQASMRLSTCTLLPVIITLLIRGHTFIGLWMGPSYVDTSGRLLQILALGLCFNASYHILVVVMMALNLHRGMVPAFLAEAAVNLGLSVVLGLSIGITGVAWGTTLPRLALAVVFGPWYARKTLGVQVRDYAVNSWARPFAAMIPFAVATLLIDRAWQVPNLVVFFLQIALVMPLAFVGVWIAALDPPDRAMLRTALGRLRERLTPAVQRA